MNYSISPRADADVDEIWTHTARDNPRSADRLEHALDGMGCLRRAVPWYAER